MKRKQINGILFLGLLLSQVFFVKIVNAQDTIKVLSYNVLYGLQKDSLVNIERYKDFVKSLKPDIVATQEMNTWTQSTLEDLGSSYGHSYALQSKEEGFPTAITSKYPLINAKKVKENMWHSYIYAKIKDIHVFVIHFSPFSYEKRLKEVAIILDEVNKLPKNEPILIMGDFNSLSASDKKAYNEETLNAMKAQEIKHEHIRNLNNGNIDYSILGELEKAGFKDTYRLKHKNFESSLPTFKSGEGVIKSSNKGTGKRIDFIWANKAASKMVIKSEIIKNKQTDIISDHYPTYVELVFKK